MFRVMDSLVRPLKLYCDNYVALFMAKNNKSRSQIKHIDIEYLAIRTCEKWSLSTLVLSC